MSTLHLTPSYEAVRPQSHQGLHSSPHESPRLPRPASQSSMHLSASYTPTIQRSDLVGGDQTPLTAYTGTPHQQAYSRGGQPMPLSLPFPNNQGYNGLAYPNTAPPMSFFQAPSTPMFDPRTSQPMIRQVSNAHSIGSAADHLATSKYIASPQVDQHQMHGPPNTGHLTSFNPLTDSAPSFTFNGTDGEERHIDPSVFNNSSNSATYSMSRSTSGASDSAGDSARLLTPHYDYRPDLYDQHHQQQQQDPRKSPNGAKMYGLGYPGGFDGYAFNSLAPHPQPEQVYMARTVSGDHYAMSADRPDMKPALPETDYERERQAQIMNNRKIMEEMGLGRASFSRPRSTSNLIGGRSRKVSTPQRRRLNDEHPSRSSNRIASMRRSVSYAGLDDGNMSDQSDGSDQYDSDGDPQDYEEGGDFHMSKRSRGGPRKRSYGRQQPYASSGMMKSSSRGTKIELSLYGLLQVYPEIPHLFPLFYYTLNNDLTINSDSVPLIGSIPSTHTPLQKADALQGFFHRARRVLAQLDAFTTRCDRKYEGPEERWPELDYHTRIAVRDVRRKVVERCENYKYTRRDLLDKIVGKNKWQPIEMGLIEWKAGGPGDPANDLSNVTLTLPTPPPGAYIMQQQQQQQQQPPMYQHSAQRQQLAGLGRTGNFPSRQIRPMPSRSRLASSTMIPRNVSITMGEPDAFAQNQQHGAILMSAPPQSQNYGNYGGAHSSLSPMAPAMYGEDQVPMSVQLNGSGLGTATPAAPHSAPPLDHTTHGAGMGMAAPASAHDGSSTAASPEVPGQPIGTNLPTVQENPWGESSSEVGGSSPLPSLTA